MTKTEKKVLKSGPVYMGVCGTPTSLYDSAGTQLHVGDLVAIWPQDATTDCCDRTPAFVVQPDEDDPYIMGLRGALRIRECLLDGELADEAHCDTIMDTYRLSADPKHVWQIVVVKPYERVVANETWEGVRLCDCDTETSLKDGVTTCCGYDFGMDQFKNGILFCPKCGRRIVHS